MLTLNYPSSKIDSWSEHFEGENIIHNTSFKEKPIPKMEKCGRKCCYFIWKIENAVKVTDVSKSNLGYDLEVQWR